MGPSTTVPDGGVGPNVAGGPEETGCAAPPGFSGMVVVAAMALRTSGASAKVRFATRCAVLSRSGLLPVEGQERGTVARREASSRSGYHHAAMNTFRTPDASSYTPFTLVVETAALEEEAIEGWSSAEAARRDRVRDTISKALPHHLYGRRFDAEGHRQDTPDLGVYLYRNARRGRPGTWRGRLATRTTAWRGPAGSSPGRRAR